MIDILELVSSLKVVVCLRNRNNLKSKFKGKKEEDFARKRQPTNAFYIEKFYESVEDTECFKNFSINYTQS